MTTPKLPHPSTFDVGRSTFNVRRLPPAAIEDIDEFWNRVTLQQAIDPETAPKAFLRAAVRVAHP